MSINMINQYVFVNIEMDFLYKIFVILSMVELVIMNIIKNVIGKMNNMFTHLTGKKEKKCGLVYKTMELVLMRRDSSIVEDVLCLKVITFVKNVIITLDLMYI